HSTIAVLAGAVLTLIAVKAFSTQMDDVSGGVVSFITPELIDIMILLTAMMIIMGVLSKTGFFQWATITAYDMAKGSPYRLVAILVVTTALLSSLLDNVTTLLLMIPITIEMSRILNINPGPLLIGEAIASNLGGASTLIGDPPNIIIGASMNISFMDFIFNMVPILAICLVVFTLMMKFFAKESLKDYKKPEDMTALRASYVVKDFKLFKRTMAIFTMVIVLFIFHDIIGIGIAEAALLGAVALLLLSGTQIDEALKSVEWSTLVFFIGLFIIVGGTGQLHLMDTIADAAINTTGGNLAFTLLLVMWLSAFAAAAIGAVPAAATLVPVVALLTIDIPNSASLFWALVIGVNLGSIATPIGATSNIIATTLSSRTKNPISFKGFIRIGMPTMLITMGIASLYVMARYVWF
ncbi:MAG: citrate transporter, partial [Candidatus Thermoplasmatota archaeon]|nr:citrate transporter [Candidatus Thermoplasmatota archaeon]